MAILFEKNNQLNKIIPVNNEYFKVKELKYALNAKDIKPMKVGPVWLLLDEDINKKQDKTDKHDSLSKFLGNNVYGNILVITSYELPKNWNLTKIDPDIKNLDTEIIEIAFLKTIQDFAEKHDIDLNNPNELDEDPYVQEYLKKQRLHYKPFQQSEKFKSSNDFLKFLEVSLPFALKYKHSKNTEMLLFEDKGIKITVVENKEKKKTFEQLIQFCIEKEKYEEAEKLNKIMKKIEKTLESDSKS